MSPSAQRIPALHYNPQILNKWDDIIFPGSRDESRSARVREPYPPAAEIRSFLHIPVRQANGTDLSICHKLLHRFVCLHIVVIRVVQEHHIHIADIQTIQTRLNRLLRVFHFAARIDFL